MDWLNTKVPPPIAGLLTGVIIWALNNKAPFVIDGLIDKTLLQKIICGVLITLAVIFDGCALYLFRKSNTSINPISPNKTSTFVSAGIYRISRNPMYVGMALLITAWGCWLATWWTIPCLFGFIAYITRFQILPEERALNEKFGSEFTTYKAKTRMWL